jgi:hypothetical protein
MPSSKKIDIIKPSFTPLSQKIWLKTETRYNAKHDSLYEQYASSAAVALSTAASV